MTPQAIEALTNELISLKMQIEITQKMEEEKRRQEESKSKLLPTGTGIESVNSKVFGLLLLTNSFNLLTKFSKSSLKLKKFFY